MSVPLSLDFRSCIEDMQLRCYFVIGERGLLDAKVQALVKRLNDSKIKLEAASITPSDQKRFALPPGFHGAYVFIQKHSSDDPDYTPGAHPGFDIHETYQQIQKMGEPLRLDPHAALELHRLKQEYADLISFMPQLHDFDRVLTIFQRSMGSGEPAGSSDRELAQTLQEEERQAKIEELNNAILSYKEALRTPLDPKQKREIQASLAAAEAELHRT